MGDVQANSINLQSARETAPGVAGTTWLQEEPHEGGIDLSADTTRMNRNIVTKNRRRKKGSIVDLSSGGSFDADLTMELINEHAEGFFFSTHNGFGPYRPTAVVAGGGSGFTIPDLNQVAEYPANTLVVASGFPDTANNGLFLVVAGSTDTLIRVNGLVADAGVADAENAIVRIAGRHFVADDCAINASGNLTSAAVNLTTLGLSVGQWIWIGGDDAATSFATAANRGYAMITSIAAGEIGLRWKEQAFVADAGAGKTIRIFFTAFLRDVGRDDADYLERSVTLETTFANLSETVPGASMYEYAVGNYFNEWTINMEVSSLITSTLGFVGFDTEPPVEAADRMTGAATPRRVVLDDAFNCSTDFARLMLAETDETGLQTDFTSLSIRISNNVSPFKLLGHLGAAKMNIGKFTADVTANAVFNHSRIPEAIRNNETLSMHWGARNADGAWLFHIPALTVAGGKKSYPTDQLVQIAETIEAVEDSTLGFSLGLSLFAYVPAA